MPDAASDTLTALFRVFDVTLEPRCNRSVCASVGLASSVVEVLGHRGKRLLYTVVCTLSVAARANSLKAFYSSIDLLSPSSHVR